MPASGFGLPALSPVTNCWVGAAAGTVAGVVASLPVDQPPFVPGAGPRPFRSRSDVLALLDDLLGTEEVAPIRDALVDALTALIFEMQYRAEYALAQADLLRATEQYLTSLGGEDRTIPRAPGEGDEDYRGRLLATPETVTERAIVTGVNVILAPFTSVQCQLVDAVLDRWFIGSQATDATRGWHSFIGKAPEYPDRLYSGQEATWGGVSRPNSDPGGARVFSQTLGRQFFLRLPDLSTRAEPSGLRQGSAERLFDIGFFVGTTTDPSRAAFPGTSSADVLSVYRAIESFVNSVAGQSIRWGFIAELEAA